jgi:hypothetical protein
MTTVNSNDLRITNAKMLLDSINGPAPDLDAHTYMFIGKPLPWSDPTDPTIGDTNPPVYRNNIQDFNNVNHQMVSLKRIFDTYAYSMIPRHTWSSGVVYDMYRHDYSYKNSAASGATDLYDAKFYVVNSNFDVYVCLFNGSSPSNRNGVVSTVEPIGTNYEAFETADGYVWMYVYSVAQSIQQYMTTNYMPIDPNYFAVPVSGEVKTIVIDSAGTNYTSSPAGLADPLPYYYCNVVGDGSGCIARVKVESGSIVKIEIVEPGADYTYAKLNFTSGNVYKSRSDLDNVVNGLNPLGDNNFNSTCIISPPGGWGYDLTRQLGGTVVGIFGDFAMDQSDFINTISFRQIGILQNFEYTAPLYENNLTLSAHYAVTFTHTNGFDFELLETIYQTVDDGGADKIAKGTLIGWDETSNVLRYIQDPNLHTDTDGKLYPFGGTNNVVGQTSGTIGYVDELNDTLDGLVFVDGHSQPEILKFTGQLLYISNIQPVQRDPNQSENIGILVHY